MLVLKSFILQLRFVVLATSVLVWNFSSTTAHANGYERVNLNGLNNYTRTLTSFGAMRTSMYKNRSEMQRAWSAAVVYVPSVNGRTVKTHIRSIVRPGAAPIPGRYPLVVFLHGCDGLGTYSLQNIGHFVRQGYAVIAPASFARTNYPISCQPSTNEGGLFDDTVKMRVADAEYTLAQAKALPWVDSSNVFLAGYSEGATTTAQVRTNSKTRVNARVIIANTCTNRWPAQRYRSGVKAHASEPVLALLGARDPWFVNNKWAKGDCGASLSKSNGSRNIVYTSGAIANSHDLLDFRQARNTIFQFLAANRR
ncbi:MAG: dienelactone hydrolase family protein [Pseudomonadota bacterium]